MLQCRCERSSPPARLVNKSQFQSHSAKLGHPSVLLGTEAVRISQLVRIEIESSRDEISTLARLF